MPATDCGHWRIAYNSCRNRHCPKCQGAAARTWLAEREADLLPVGYFHVVFTLPAEVADIALQNKAIVYDLLFRAASETMMTIAADPKHLGARIGITAVLHTWGSAMTHHPHIHMIVPGGGISLDGRRWVSSRPAFLLPVRVLGMLFRRLFLTRLIELHDAGRLAFFGTQAGLADRRVFLRHLAPQSGRSGGWSMPSRRSAGPEAVLAYLSRYTHRVAISNRRLIAFDETGVTFRYKDYRRDGPERQRVMTLAPHEFIRRFLLHVLPRGFHRIRHYGLLASSARKASIARARELLAVAPPPEPVESPEPLDRLPALSLLRRAHDHHRDLRALEATPRATSRAHTNREHPVVIRHGLRSPHAATPPLRRMRPCTLFAKITANGLNMQPPPAPDLPSAWRQISLTTSLADIQRRAGYAITHNQAKLEIPIDHRRNPAGSCMGGFRTPAPCPTRDLRWPASENLHHGGPVPRRAAFDGRRPKTFTIAAVQTRGTVSPKRSFAGAAANDRVGGIPDRRRSVVEWRDCAESDQ